MNDHVHVVVGDGITALAFLETCLGKRLGQIVVIGKIASHFGRGAAYARGQVDTPWRYAYLLNSPADDIDPEFAVWLESNWQSVAKTMAGRRPDWLSAARQLVEKGDVFGVNAPREFYGDYIEERSSQVFERLRAEGTSVSIIDDTAISIEPQEASLNIRTLSGLVIRARTADLAPGGPETLRIKGDQSSFSVPSVFGYEHEISKHIKGGAEIFCIGGNAAMLDVLRLCQSQVPEHKLKFAYCAPRGEVPPALVPRLPRKLTRPDLTPGHKTARSFLTELRHEIDRAEKNGDNRREIRAGFRQHFLDNSLNRYLSNPTDAHEVSKRLRFWLRGGTRDTIHDLERLVGRGSIDILAGRALEIEPDENGVVVHLEADNGARYRHRTDFVVNCAGAGPNSKYDALTEYMLAKNTIERGPNGGLKTEKGSKVRIPRVRYLSPAVTQVGDEVIAMPLYDAFMLRTYVSKAEDFFEDNAS